MLCVLLQLLKMRIIRMPSLSGLLKDSVRSCTTQHPLAPANGQHGWVDEEQ